MLGALDRKHEADFDHTHVWVGGIPEVSQTLLLTEVRSRCISQSRSGTESTPRKPLGLESLARPTSGHLVGGAGTVLPRQHPEPFLWRLHSKSPLGTLPFPAPSPVVPTALTFRPSSGSEQSGHVGLSCQNPLPTAIGTHDPSCTNGNQFRDFARNSREKSSLSPGVVRLELEDRCFWKPRHGEPENTAGAGGCAAETRQREREPVMRQKERDQR